MSPADLDIHKKRDRKIGHGNLLQTVMAGFSSFFRKASSFCRQKLTIMFIPHSEKKAVNFRVSFLSLAFMLVLFTGLLVLFIVSSAKFSGMSDLLDDQTASLATKENNEEIFQDNIVELKKINIEFMEEFDSILELLGMESADSGDINSNSDGDMRFITDLQEQKDGFSRELSDLESFGKTMKEAMAVLDQVVNNVSVYKEFLPKFPTLWPIKGGEGVVTSEFGPNMHPVYHNLYLHKGIDLSYYRGAKIVAAADGKIVQVGIRHPELGNFVMIRHEFGMYTKYAHLDSVKVKEGDLVKQGQYIGDLGNTGLSTGPHLHYEIHVGSQVIDPRKFIFIQKNMMQ
jgi:murein DD-endopeptidase MepM/ murein hydrolase activator NlpD